MPSGDFEGSLSVEHSPADCWGVLTDVHRVSKWVSVVGEVTEVEHLKGYAAVLEDQFGPFKLKADLDIQVTDLDEGNSISFKAKGKDRQVATTIIVDATLSLQPSDRGTQIMVRGRWNVIGTVATMGSGTIRKKADSIMDEFFSAAREELS
ncbi:MAG TPA: SRPBCC domain-containing protein [Acidimicrobiia bacterium]|nr:SRPBCC domain-containing protein [Acidimicrobiia bacterium]